MSDCSAPIINDSSITNTTYNYDGLENDTKYYWKVNGKNTEGQGQWSQIWNLTTSLYAKPVLVTPLNNNDWTPITGKFTWNKVNSVINYYLKVSNNSDLSSPIILDSGFT